MAIIKELYPHWGDPCLLVDGEEIPLSLSLTEDISLTGDSNPEVEDPTVKQWAKGDYNFTFEIQSLDASTFFALKKMFRFRVPRKVKKRQKKLLARRCYLPTKRWRYSLHGYYYSY